MEASRKRYDIYLKDDRKVKSFTQIKYHQARIMALGTPAARSWEPKGSASTVAPHLA